MESTLILNTEVQELPPIEIQEPVQQKEQASFIVANTIPSSLEEMKKDHIIPVYHKTNEPVISKVDFIEIMEEAASKEYPPELILRPSLRLSHVIKGF